MKNFFILTIMLILASCSNFGKSIKVKITNNSASAISDIKCYTSENTDTLSIIEMKIDEQVSGVLPMKKNKADGSYIIEFTSEQGEIRKYNQGYYSNGVPLNDRIEFEILEDSIKFKMY